VKNPLKHKKKDSESTFLKSPIDSVMAHVGKIADNSNAQQLADAFVMLTLAAYGVKTAYATKQDPLAMALLGPLGYKLATTMGGTPPVSQIAGLGILSGLGVAGFVTGELAPANTPQGIANRIVKLLETGAWIP